MTVSLIGGAALALVSLQLAATAVVQHLRPRALYRLDRFGILPGWTFFLQPPQHDVAVDARWLDPAGTPGPWREIWTPLMRRRWSWLWAPEGLTDGALLVAISALEQRDRDRTDAGPDTSLAYATLLALARETLSDPGASGVQFAVVRVHATEREPRYVSQVHPC